MFKQKPLDTNYTDILQNYKTNNTKFYLGLNIKPNSDTTKIQVAFNDFFITDVTEGNKLFNITDKGLIPIMGSTMSDDILKLQQLLNNSNISNIDIITEGAAAVPAAVPAAEAAEEAAAVPAEEAAAVPAEEAAKAEVPAAAAKAEVPAAAAKAEVPAAAKAEVPAADGSTKNPLNKVNTHGGRTRRRRRNKKIASRRRRASRRR
jgi:hypothetical protein